MDHALPALAFVDEQTNAAAPAMGAAPATAAEIRPDLVEALAECDAHPRVEPCARAALRILAQQQADLAARLESAGA